VRNNDKVGLILFTDEVEQYVPPRKGRSHVLRVVREILFFDAQRRGTDVVKALEYANQVLKRRAVVFLLSDFLVPLRARSGAGAAPPGGMTPLRRTLEITARRHDLVGVVVSDPREAELPDVGRVLLEDAETDEQLEIDTHDAVTRLRFAEAAEARRAGVLSTLRGAGIDTLELSTAAPYLSALLRFFQRRATRLR
jgi:uncharacterized protein (DUF58 family)